MKPQSIKLTLTVQLGVVFLLLAGCSTLPRGEDATRALLARSDLPAAEQLLLLADKSGDEDPDAAMVFRLRAGEIAWDHLATGQPGKASISSLSSADKQALDILARSSSAVAINWHLPSERTQTFDFAGWLYRLDTNTSTPGQLPVAQIQSMQPASQMPRKILHNWHAASGLGEPMVVTLRKSQDPAILRFTPLAGHIVAATALLSYQDGTPTDGGRNANLKILDSTVVESWQVGRRTFPLSYDLTAPLYSHVAGVPELLKSLSVFFIADRAEARLIMLEPYDPDKIPLVLVHGLISNPLMWRDVINEIRSNKDLRDRYQIWTFFYPTGWPITYSASKLRDELKAAEETFGQMDQMVFVGHSMGGLLTRLQIISPGRVLWDAQFDDKADELYRTLPSDHLARRLLLFEANPDIERAVFISTPHRGSRMADLSIVHWVQRFVRMPGQIVRTIVDMPLVEISRLQFNSLSSLSPENPTLHGMDKVPIPIPYHSIIGDRGRGDTPNSSDGVVEYWSSHLEGAESELIVPSDHGAHDDPLAIAEVERILALHAGLPAPPAVEATANESRLRNTPATIAPDPVRRSGLQHPARRR